MKCANDFGERNSLAAVGRDVIVADDMECVGVLHSFWGGVRGVGANPLAQASQLVAVRGVPSVGEAGVAAKGAVIQGLACFGVKHGEGERLPLVAVQDLGRCPSLNELGWEGA